MAFTLKRKIYESVPLWMKQSTGLIPFPWIAGKAYREVFVRGIWFDKASREDLLKYQETQLASMLPFLVEQVPAYQHLKRIVEQMRPFEALKNFPLLDKETIQANLDKYLPVDFNKSSHYETTTGGTSGNQLKLYLYESAQPVEIGFMHRQWKRVGYTPSHRKATFRGVAFPNVKPGVFWQHNPIYNELQFSPFHMSENNLKSYVNQIIGFKPSYFHGYPSAIDILAEYVSRHKMTNKMPKIKAVLLGSEGCAPGQRERIENAFRTRVFSWYGHSERVVLAGECEKNNTYHHFPDYGILEIIDEQGRSCEKSGKRGEIVGTSIFNYCMPLIRYRTGDYATRLDTYCECGRQWDRFTDVEGRWKQDMLIGKNGARISIAALNIHGPIFEKVKRYQYVQNEVGICVLNLMVTPSFSEADRIAIEKAYFEKTGNELQWKVETVDDIPLTTRGKHKLLCSSLKGES